MAFKALEPQLVREHELLMRRLAVQEAAGKRADANAKAAAELEARRADAKAAAELEARRAREERQHKRHLAGLYTGAAISTAMLAGGVYVAKDAWWLAVLLCGPSLVAMGKIFVLRRSDPSDMQAVSQVSRSAASAASQP
ncbi:hypothetical protein [Streptomyces sp. NPDC002580]|uniref:hypothetical protein n=1 Tax=Streptomyces sp. NPDC002580 TaxID=3364653 RepID=UPI00368C8B1F